jgi:MSHA biogenesis protein MshJ
VKRLWQLYVGKMDGASLRERGMVFAASAAVLIALLNALLIEPQLVKQRRLSGEVSARQGEMRIMQEKLQALALTRQADPDRDIRRQLDALKQKVAETEAKLLEEQRKFAPPEQVGVLLGEMLSRNRKLQLVDLRTLPVASFAGNAAEADKAPPQQPAAAKPAAPAAGGQIYRHGVEITVSGSYLDLLAYLKDLEKLPNQLYWGKLDLNAATYPQVTLKLSVYTLSLNLAWLVV